MVGERRRVSGLASALAILTSLAMAGCGGGGSSSSKSGDTTVVVDGSSTVFRISKAAQEAFADYDDSITIVVDNHGTGGGFGRYLQGEVDIVDASRPAKAEEESSANDGGMPWTRFIVGYDGISLVANPKNDWAKTLTVEQLKSIWAADSKIQTWKEIDPSWPDKKIVLFSPDNDSGTFEFFVEAILGKGNPQRVAGVQQSGDDNVLVTGVAGDEGSLGYFGYAYYAANTNKIQALAVQNGADAQPVTPSPETILSKEYAPLSRPLFIYVKNSAGKRAEVAKFLRYYIDHVETLAVQGGYVAPTPADREANALALKTLLGE